MLSAQMMSFQHIATYYLHLITGSSSLCNLLSRYIPYGSVIGIDKIIRVQYIGNKN